MSTIQKERDKSVLYSFHSIYAPYQKWAIFCLLLALLSALSAIGLTYFTKKLVEQTAAEQLAFVSVWLFILLVAASAVWTGLLGVSAGKFGAYAGRDLRQEVASRLMKAEYRAVQSLSSGDTISIVNNDCRQIGVFLGSDFFMLIAQLLTASVAFVYLLMLHPLLGLLTFAYTPVGMVMANRVNRRLNRLHPIASEQKGEVLHAVEQALASVPIIKSFGMERWTGNRLGSAFQLLYKTEKQMNGWNALLQPACLSVANAPTILFTAVGGWYALSGKLELSVYIAIVQLLGFIIPPTVMLPFMLNNLNKVRASLKRVERYLALPIDRHAAAEEENDATRVLPTAAYIDVQQVEFAYEPQTPVLKGLSFAVNEPGVVAITGASGSGKSTLLALLSGLYQPDQGAIHLGYRHGEAGSSNPSDRRQPPIAVMPQDIHVFHASLFDNIQVGRPHAVKDEVLAAAQHSGTAEFAASLGSGVDTMIGAGGAPLSGGQAQKLGLARVYLTEAPIWLLDEPTSAMDGISEAEFHRFVLAAARQRIIMIVAHRLSTIQLADRILFMSEGVIAADGSWELLQQHHGFAATVLAAGQQRQVEVQP